MRTVSLEYAKKLARRWESGQIPATDYYYQQARRCLDAFRDFLPAKEHGLLVGLVEFYNHHQ